MTTMTNRQRQRVALTQLDDNPWQPRRDIDPEALADLAKSIQRQGLLQEPLARYHPQVSGRYQIAFGHRRVEAMRLLQAGGHWPDYVEIAVAAISDEDMALMGLAENVRRKDLSAIEVARAHRKALDETELTATELADQLNIHISTLSNNLRALELPDLVLGHVEAGHLSLGVAREFLALQGPDCQHLGDMEDVIDSITNVERYGSGVPDWRRKHVRKLISERVSFLENPTFRPIGPKTGHERGKGNLEPGFDVAAFETEYRDYLHTIPADDGASESYRRLERYEESRVWTCQAREWTRRQTAATREANKSIDVHSGQRAPRAQPSANARPLEQLLAKDPVWRQIVARREEPGPDHPVTPEETELLGTRAKFHQVGYDRSLFYKILEKGDPEQVRDWDDTNGGHLPPFFPDLSECQRCIIGAAYAGSEHGYPMRKPALVCFNQDHYEHKLRVGAAEYREKLDAQKTGAVRQDMRTARNLSRSLAPLNDDSLRAVALAMLISSANFEWEHPFGRLHTQWSYEPGTVVRIREILGDEVAEKWETSGRTGFRRQDAAGVLDHVAPEDLRELLSLLMTYRLRQGGMIDLDFSREKLDGSEVAPPDDGPETRRCTACGQDKGMDDFGRQRRNGPNGEYFDIRPMCKQCTREKQAQRRSEAATAAA